MDKETVKTMSESEVVLPNGRTVLMSGLPENVTEAQIREDLLAQGVATIDEFNFPETSPEAEDPNWLMQNLDLPAGIAASLAGAKMGAPLGIPGIVAGGIAGGAIGTFGGSLLSDAVSEEELDFAKATEEALFSAGFDVATLTLGKYIKPGYFAAKKSLGFTPKEVAADVIKTVKQGQETGTLESLRASQDILQSKGATLTRFQTGQASAMEVFGEKLANAGLFSGKEVADNALKVNTAAQEALNDIANKIDYTTGNAPKDIGEAMVDVITAGKQALSNTYGEGLDQISSKVKKNTVSTAGIKKRLQQFIKDNSEITQGYVLENGKRVLKKKSQPMLNEDTLNYINKNINGVLELSQMSAEGLLRLDKKIAADVRQFGDIRSSNYNSVADREMGELTNILKDSFINTLKQADPKVAEEYAALKAAYKEGMSGLLPEVNKNLIKNAEKGSYDQLGGMLLEQKNVSKISTFMKSIDEAYKQIDKSGEGVANIAYATAKDAKQAIKQGFLANAVPKLNDEAFKIEQYANLAAQFSKPAQASRLKAVMGEDYGRVKQIFNLFAEASKKPDSNVGTLVLRAKEYGALGTLAFGATTGGLTAIASAGAVLASPIVLAKMAANPKAVNKLLAFEKMTFKNDELKEKAAALIVSDVMDKLTEEEQQEVKDYFRTQ